MELCEIEDTQYFMEIRNLGKWCFLKWSSPNIRWNKNKIYVLIKVWWYTCAKFEVHQYALEPVL